MVENSVSQVHPELTPTARRQFADVVANRLEGTTNWRLTLRLAQWDGFAPGQFIMLAPGVRSRANPTDPLMPRPMAIYRSGRSNGSAEVEILYKVVGRGTARLAEAVPGQQLGLLGPLGQGFPEPPAGSRVVLVGGGTGIASLYELASRNASRTRVEVLLGARTADELMGVDDFDRLDVGLGIATQDGSHGATGRVTELLEPALDSQPAIDAVYACGPTPMMRRAAELAMAHGVRCLVSIENHMACGYGVCLGCAAPLESGGFALVCRDGPVFEATALAWDELP